MKSKIYNGYVEHTRHLPAFHRFRYPVYMYGLDLDELPLLDRRLPFFGYNRVRPAAVHDIDYLDQKPGAIREKLTRFLPDAVRKDMASVMLITSARYFHYVFNPVCFYYCMDRQGGVLQVVVEVSNTYGERHVYVPEKKGVSSGNAVLRFSAEKAFHVSPFNDMAGRYAFFFSPPGEVLDVRIDLVRDDEKIFEARLWGRGRELTKSAHMANLLRHPFMPHLTMPRIMLEAARLYYRKRLKWHDKPPPADSMTIRHRSIQ